MTTYSVYFRTDRNYAFHDIETDTPEQALALARQLRDSGDIYQVVILPDRRRFVVLVANLDFIDRSATVITVKRRFVVLRLAAADLLSAAEKILDRWQNGDLGEVIDELAVAVAKAKGGVA